MQTVGDHGPTIIINNGVKILIMEGSITYPKGRREPFGEEEILGKPALKELDKPIEEKKKQYKEEVHILGVSRVVPPKEEEFDKEEGVCPIHLVKIGPVKNIVMGKVYMVSLAHDIYKDGRPVAFTDCIFMRVEPMVLVRPAKGKKIQVKENEMMVMEELMEE